MYKVKGIIGTHKWGLYHNHKLISVHLTQNCAIQAKYSIQSQLDTPKP